MNVNVVPAVQLPVNTFPNLRRRVLLILGVGYLLTFLLVVILEVSFLKNIFFRVYVNHKFELERLHLSRSRILGGCILPCQWTPRMCNVQDPKSWRVIALT